jgi:hypothetical protein
MIGFSLHTPYFVISTDPETPILKKKKQLTYEALLLSEVEEKLREL